MNLSNRFFLSILITTLATSVSARADFNLDCMEGKLYGAMGPTTPTPTSKNLGFLVRVTKIKKNPYQENHYVGEALFTLKEWSRTRSEWILNGVGGVNANPVLAQKTTVAFQIDPHNGAMKDLQGQWESANPNQPNLWVSYFNRDDSQNAARSDLKSQLILDATSMKTPSGATLKAPAGTDQIIIDFNRCLYSVDLGQMND